MTAFTAFNDSTAADCAAAAAITETFLAAAEPAVAAAPPAALTVVVTLPPLMNARELGTGCGGGDQRWQTTLYAPQPFCAANAAATTCPAAIRSAVVPVLGVHEGVESKAISADAVYEEVRSGEESGEGGTRPMGMRQYRRRNPRRCIR